jgi:hypothetical protein
LEFSRRNSTRQYECRYILQQQCQSQAAEVLYICLNICVVLYVCLYICLHVHT